MKYKLVRDYSGNECGTACLVSICRHYGKILTTSHCREICRLKKSSTSIKDLSRGAEVLGFDTQAVKASLKSLNTPQLISLPVIIHWKGIRWLIFYGTRNNIYIVGDPSRGIKHLSEEEFARNWTGYMLLLIPSPERFYDISDCQQKISTIYLLTQQILLFKRILIISMIFLALFLLLLALVGVALS